MWKNTGVPVMKMEFLYIPEVLLPIVYFDLCIAVKTKVI